MLPARRASGMHNQRHVHGSNKDAKQKGKTGPVSEQMSDAPSGKIFDVQCVRIYLRGQCSSGPRRGAELGRVRDTTRGLGNAIFSCCLACGASAAVLVDGQKYNTHKKTS